MKARASTRSLASAVVVAGFLLAPVPSMATELVVSTYGQNDSTCGSYVYPARPCKTLQYALNKAASGDTLVLVLVGDYGPATVARAVNIRGAPGAGIYSPAGVPCLTINAGVNDLVSIAGVTCDQAGASKDGIVFNSGHRLRLVDVTLQRGGSAVCGIRFRPNNNAEFDFSEVRASNWGLGGICVQPRAGADVRGVIENASLQDNMYGILSMAGAGLLVAVTCDGCRIAGGTVGAYSNGVGSTVRLKGDLISNNGTGLSRPNNGKVVSNGGNSVIGNTINGTFTATEPAS